MPVGSRRSWLLLSLGVLACGPEGEPASEGADEASETTQGETTQGETTGDDTSDDTSDTSGGPSSGPESDPLETLDCWQPLGALPAREVWGESTQALLLATTEGLLRVEGDAMTTIGSGPMTALWVTDLDNGWVGLPTGLLRLVDGQLEPGPDVAFEVEAIEGLGPDDVWAAGTVGIDADALPLLLRFDGMTWTPVDIEATFGVIPDHPISMNEMVVAGNNLYIGSRVADFHDGLWVWDGQQPSLTPGLLGRWSHVSRLSTRDGTTPLAWVRWCDFGCITDLGELSGDAWVAVPTPAFADWENVRERELVGDGAGGMWAVVAPDEIFWEEFRVARSHEGGWLRARVPYDGHLHATSDGVVLISAHPLGPDLPHRATSACLFGA